MSNIDCMEGLRCPSCKQKDELRIEMHWEPAGKFVEQFHERFKV